MESLNGFSFLNYSVVIILQNHSTVHLTTLTQILVALTAAILAEDSVVFLAVVVTLVVVALLVAGKKIFAVLFFHSYILEYKNEKS